MRPLTSDASTTSLPGTSSSVSTSTVTSSASSFQTSSVPLVFRDQLSLISNWFGQWNECERTVALYSLLNRLSPTQARFLSYSLQHIFASNDDLHRQEQSANNPVFLSRLRNESKENALNILLAHLPLLHPGNEECKALYLSLVTKILAHSVANVTHLEESRQLLSYTLMHPALSAHDRRVLTSYLRNLDELLNPNHESPLDGNDHFKNSSYHYNGSVNSYPQNGISFSDNELCSSSNTFINAWDANIHNNNIPNGQSLHGASSFGSNSLPSGMTSAHMAMYGVNSVAGQPLIANGVNNNNLFLMQHNRLKRSHSLTPFTNGVAPDASTGLMSSANSGVIGSFRPQQSFPSSGAGTSLPMNHFISNNVISNNATQHQQVWTINGNNYEPLFKLSSKKNDRDSKHHNTLSPQHSIASSGSGSGSENCLSNSEPKNAFDMPGSGMRDVPAWLKCLRLHKYANLFISMTYEQMLQLTEQKLERLNVTKGARHKIILNITKLKDRPKVIIALEKDLNEDGVACVRQVLNELKNILMTPIKAFNGSHKVNGESMKKCGDENSNGRLFDGDCDNSPNDYISENDLPALIIRLLRKVYNTMPNVSSQTDDDSFTLFITIIEKCLSHEAFTSAQKRCLSICKQKAQEMCSHLPNRRSLDSRQMRGKWGHNVSTAIANTISNKIGSNNSNAVHSASSSAFQKRISLVSSSIGLSSQLQPSSTVLNTAMNNNNNNTQEFIRLNNYQRPLEEHLKSHSQICRTHSAPVRHNNHLSPTENVNSVRDSDREQLNDIESLCIRMTEQALGPDGGLSC